MPYLVDGNNVIGGFGVSGPNPSRARRRLIEDLARFVAVHRVKLKVVFDGTPDEDFPEGCKFKSVHILYARPGSDADSRIRELVAKSSHKRDMVMVSSDRALVSFAERQGARALPSGRFKTQLRQARERMAAEKDLARDGIELEEWLDYFQGTRQDLRS